MVDVSNIRQLTIPRPDAWTLLGSTDDYDRLPGSHKEQILFLDAAATKFIYEYLSSAKLVGEDISDPFSKGNFKTVEKFNDLADTDESRQRLKKWLFKRGIAFRTWVYVLPNYNRHPILMTWKMVIKYSFDLFFNDDVTIFDDSLNWCLFYFHHNILFFGKDNMYDPADDYKRMEALNEVKKKYPHFKFPY